MDPPSPPDSPPPDPAIEGVDLFFFDLEGREAEGTDDTAEDAT